MIQFRDAVQGDLVAIAPLLRDADAEEWRMGSGKRPVAMIEEDGYRLPTGPGTLNRVALDDHGSPLILYGVNPSAWGPGQGWVWLIANKRAPAHYRHFAPRWGDELKRLLAQGYTDLVTASWVGNEHHHRWLADMGFVPAGDPLTFGPYGARFKPFRLRS